MSFVGKEFITSATKRLKYYRDLGDKTFEQLGDWDFSKAIDVRAVASEEGRD